MAEKLAQLGLGTEVRELKIGQSFNKSSGVGFHTIRYDFKPASVDPSKMGVLEVGESNSVSVTVPHLNGSGVTNFGGHIKESNKEYILMIDPDTGEITLEKISNQILLKKTRQEKPDKSELPPVKKPSRLSPASSTVSPSHVSSSSPHQLSAVAAGTAATTTTASNARPLLPASTSAAPSTYYINSHKPPPSTTAANENRELLDSSSMPTSIFDVDDFSDDISQPPPNPTNKQPQEPPHASATTVADLSESSSSSSSSDSDSDSDDFDEVKVPSSCQNGNSESVTAPSMPSFSMPSFSTSPPESPTKRQAAGATTVSAPPPATDTAAAAASISAFLSDDLQLSESEDSD